MTMTHDQLHTHGPDELAMLRAECDKWHKAYDRVWEERMRFADRAIELEKENKELKEERRHKYKRCLAMAEMCNARYNEEDEKVNGCGASWDYTSKEMKYWERWEMRWLELAEKFKEAK